MKESQKIRYDRHIRLSDVGQVGQEKLLKARILVVGAGGLGCPVLQYLVSSGVGSIGIVDGDIVQLSNLQRQILYSTNDIGENKAVVARKKLIEMNSDCEITAFPQFLDVENASDLISKYDIVIDGTDQIHMRYLLSDICRILDKPLIYGAVHKYEGQLSVFNYKNGPDYRNLFPSPPKGESLKSCNEIGVLGVLTGVIGSLQANEAIKIILGIGEVLSGRLYTLNLLNNKSNTIEFSFIKSSVERPNSLIEFRNTDYLAYCNGGEECEILLSEIDWRNESLEKVIIDIRNENELPKLKINHLRMDILNDRFFESCQKDVLLICQSGIRSLTMAINLREKGFKNVYSVKGGVRSLNSEFFEELQIKY